MISFCTLLCNARYEFRTFVEALAYHNPDVDFEVCVAHDDRVEDGSREFLDKLQSEYPQVKIVRNTHSDAKKYLSNLIDYYRCQKIFSMVFRNYLSGNLAKYERGTLCNPRDTYLWIALGYLFNKAANIATGDILMFAPADYIWPINLRALEEYVIQNRKDGRFYGKFGGSYHPVSNEPIQDLIPFVDKFFGERLTRSYTHYPSKLSDHFLLSHGKAFQLGTPTYQRDFIEICKAAKGTPYYADMHHGTHIMTRKTFDTIGGFTEEFYGRAWPDDKMNAHAMRLFWEDSSTMPVEFSFSFIPMAEWKTSISGIHPEQQTSYEPQLNKHPIQGRNYYQTYLHHGYPNEEYITRINATLDTEFAKGNLRGREAPVVRLV